MRQMASRTLTLSIALVLWIAAGAASSLPMDYDLLFDGALAGGFTLDPALATPAGISDVDVTAFALSVNVSGFGAVAFDLTDITANAPRGRFLDGQLATLTTVGATGTLPDGSGFVLDLTPFVPANVGLIDLTMAGQYNLTIVDIGGGFPDEIGSFGMALKDDSPTNPVPEPNAALVFAAGIGVASFVSRRGQRTRSPRI